MSDDRLQAIIAKQRQAAERREFEAAELRRLEEESQRRDHDLFVRWSEVRDSLKKFVFDLNRAMKTTGVKLAFRENERTWKVTHSAVIHYEAPRAYQHDNNRMAVSVSFGRLHVEISMRDGESHTKEFALEEFTSEVQKSWVLLFLERTAEG